MLAILTVGHFNLILHSMREVLQGEQDAPNPRAKSAIVSLDRSLLGFVRELRLSGKRALANPAIEVRPKERTAAPETAQPPTTNPASGPAPATPPQSHGRAAAGPPPAAKTGLEAAAFAASGQNRPPETQTKSKLLSSTTASRPSSNIPLFRQPEQIDPLAAFEQALAAAADTLSAANRELENAAGGE